MTFNLIASHSGSVVDHVSTKVFPRHFSLHNDLVLVANQKSDNIQVFKRGENGLLTEVCSLDGIEKPTCVVPFL